MIYRQRLRTWTKEKDENLSVPSVNKEWYPILKEKLDSLMRM